MKTFVCFLGMRARTIGLRIRVGNLAAAGFIAGMSAAPSASLASTCDVLFAPAEFTEVIDHVAMQTTGFLPHVLHLATDIAMQTRDDSRRGNTARAMTAAEFQTWVLNVANGHETSSTQQSVSAKRLVIEFERMMRSKEFSGLTDRNRQEWNEISRHAEAAYNKRIELDAMAAYLKASGEELPLREFYFNWVAEFLTYAKNIDEKSFAGPDGRVRSVDRYRIEDVQSIARQRLWRHITAGELHRFAAAQLQSHETGEIPIYPPLFEAVKFYFLRDLPPGRTFQQVLAFETTGERNADLALLHSRFKKSMLELGYSDAGTAEATVLLQTLRARRVR